MVSDKRVITLLIEQRLEIDGTDSMEKVIIHQTIPITVNIDQVLDKVRELLLQAEQNSFTFL